MIFSRAPIGSRRWALVAAAALLALFAWCERQVARDASVTFDEPEFIVAGLSYLTPGSAEIATTNLRLAQIWMAAPLLPLRPILPDSLSKTKGLIITDDVELGLHLLDDPKNQGDLLLIRSRLAVVGLGLLLGGTLFFWVRRTQGEGAALVTLAFFCLNPVVLANSALATTDIAITLAFVLATAAWWKLLHRVTLLTVALAGLGLGALLTTKISGVMIAPIILTMWAARMAVGPAVMLGWIRPTRACPGWGGVRWTAVASVGATVIAYGVIWAIYGFKYSSGQPLGADTWAVLTDAGATPLQRAIGWMQCARFLPEAFLYDFKNFTLTVRFRRGFLLGEYSLTGWWYFFPVVWFFKAPLPWLAAVALGVAGIVASWRRRIRGAADALVNFYELVPLLSLGVIYGGATMMGNLNIGIRHWLPVFPGLFVVAGLAVCWPWPARWRFGVIGLLLGWSGVEAWRALPDPLAYFNPLGGGMKNGHLVAIDSSLEWGQGLPALERWLGERGRRSPAKRPVYLSYFGSANLRRFKIEARLLPQFPDKREPMAYPLFPGTYVISATMLHSFYGVMFGPWRPSLEAKYQSLLTEIRKLDPYLGDRAALDRFVAQDGSATWRARALEFDWLRFGRLCAWLRTREPDSRVTPSLLVYELELHDLRSALLGPPVEMKSLESIKGVEKLPATEFDFIK